MILGREKQEHRWCEQDRRARANRAVDEIKEMLTDLHEGHRLVYGALKYIIRGRAYYELRDAESDAVDKLRQCLRDIDDNTKAIERRLPAPPSLWQRLRNRMRRDEVTKWWYKLWHGATLADGGYVSKQPVADWFRAQPLPAPPPAIALKKLAEKEAAKREATAYLRELAGKAIALKRLAEYEANQRRNKASPCLLIACSGLRRSPKLARTQKAKTAKAPK